jgi:Icc protein
MVPVAEVIELLDTERLAEVLEGSDVRAILGGHYHFPSHSTFAGIPVSVAAATCYLADPAPRDRFISAVDGNTSVNAVHVYADRVVHTIVPVPEGPEVSGFGMDVAPLVEALSPAERRDMISRRDSDFNRGALV